MRKSLFLMMGVIMLITSCSKTNNDTINGSKVTAASKSTPAGRHSRPFKGYMNYAFATNVDLPCDCGTYYVAGTFCGTGSFTELGASTSKIKPCVSPIFSGSTQTGNHVGVECAVFVAADGDELYLYVHPYDLMFGASAAAGTCYAEFVGGTGRFASATGGFSGTVTVPYTTGTAALTDIDGAIEY